MHMTIQRSPDILTQDLRQEIAKRQVVLIVGAGVSAATTANDAISCWTGLLLDGVDRCKAVVPGLPLDWADRMRSEINSGDMDDLLSAAEKISSKLSAHGEYGRWLRETVGELKPKDRSVIDSLKQLNAPILTTNYDSLIEAVTGWPTVTWSQTADVEYVIRGEAEGVLHLHGHWQDPQSVVLGLRSYEAILRSQHAQTMLQALRSTRTFLFVGYGEGLQDPNFNSLLHWARQIFSASPFRHYRLVLRQDMAATQTKTDPTDRIYNIPYGEEYAELAGFLRRLGGEVSSPPSLPQSRAHVPQDLGEQLKAWFQAVGYHIENYEQRAEEYFEWIINQPTGLGFLRILVRGIEGLVERHHVVDLRAAVEKHKTDGGWLLTFRRVDPGARDEERGSRSRPKIFCLTFDELIDQHADFTNYLNKLEKSIKNLGVSKYYVPLACLKQEFDSNTGRVAGEARFNAHNGSIDRYIDQWLDDPSKGHISILGEFGSGKTWFTLHYALRTLRRYKRAKRDGRKRPRLPLLISLRDYVKAGSLESLLSAFFFRRYEIRLPGYSAFELLNRMGAFLLIFDGFDEMASRVDRQQLTDHFLEIARVAVPGAKVILTCRTEHFPNESEVHKLLSSHSVGFEVLKLDKFTDAQIRRVLAHQADPTIVDAIMSKPDLLDLVRRPIMTSFVVESIQDVEADRPIDVARMYLYTARRKMEGDIKQGRTFTSLADKLYFLCELSWEMLLTNRMSLNYRSLPDLLRRLLGDAVRDQKDLDSWRHSMVGQTLLVRNAEGDYSLAHKSLAEFFAAYKLVAQLGVLAPDFLDLAKPQSHLADVPARLYAWSEYFKREFDESGEVKRIAPLLQFVPDDSVRDLPINQEPAGRRLSYNTLRFAAAMVDKTPIALFRLCQLCWTTTDELAWNSQELLPFLREEQAAELARMLVDQSDGLPLMGIPWVLGELGIASDAVRAALLNTVDTFTKGGHTDANSWWHAAFALRKLGIIGSDKERDEIGPVKFLIERRPPGCTLESALTNLRNAIAATNLRDARISECDVVTIAESAGSGHLNAQELYDSAISKIDFGSDPVRLRCYYLVWLCGYLKLGSSLKSLVRATKHVRGPVRNCAVNAFGRIGIKTTEVIAALEDGLRDHYYRARFHSAWSLWDVRATESLHALSDAIAAEEVSSVREAMLNVKRFLERG